MNHATGDVMTATLIALAAGLAFIAGCAIRYGREITASRIPMQWGTNGRPTWFAPRLVGLWFSFGFTAIVSAFLLVLAYYQPQQLMGLIAAIVIVIGTNMWVQIYHLKRVVGWQTETPPN
jgi:apolipoprotein N-acyltransferase